MFSQLGPLFRTQFRKAESNDTRQYIPHEERDRNRRERNEQENEQDPSDAWIDAANVSVKALRAFLIDFLKTMPGSGDSSFIKEREKATNLPKRPKEEKRPTNTHNARAVRAYQTMAAHSHFSTTEKSSDITSNEKGNEPTADKVESKELRDIHNLIISLENLEKKGISTLQIFQADSFVESLKNAVQLAKKKT